MRVEAFPAVRSVGSLLPRDILAAVAAGTGLDGLRPADYGLAEGESVRQAANRSWDRLRTAWAAFRAGATVLSDDTPRTEPTRSKWLRPLFEELGYGRLPAVPVGGLAVDGVDFPVSHEWQRTPVHLLGIGVPLDRKTPGVAGAAKQAPHSLVQEVLNRSDAHLWGLVSNGLTLRLLRDSATLVRQAYVEFDLEAMFEGELFADFALLWQVCHASRVEPRPDPSAAPATCWLEAWRDEGAARGVRALSGLRDGVTEALRVLGRGFLAASPELRERLRDESLRPRDYHRLLLRVVYQLLILFVAEDRGLLHPETAGPAERSRYAAYFSTARLRKRAIARATNDRHTDVWSAWRLVTAALGSPDGLPALGLPGLGGVYREDTLAALEDARIANRDLLAAVRALATTREATGTLRPVDYRNLGAEELGSVYESLLEFVPAYDPHTGAYELDVQAGSDRKTTGSYYTPSGLVEILLDEALDPVLDVAEHAADPEAALLAVTVCDPACGSGHFLAAAGRRIARRLAAVRTGDTEPTVESMAAAMRDVVSHCLYGVDLNPLAAELARVALWLEALEPGRPLSFLDAHVKVGNALNGATPDLVDGGLPDAAFTALTDDDRVVVSALKRRNRAERTGQGTFAYGDESPTFAASFRALDDAPEETLHDVRAKETAWREAEADTDLRRAKLAADAWCAAFVWPRNTEAAPGITSAEVHDVADRGADALSQSQLAVLDDLRTTYGFFHWALEFPDVLPGGFSCVLGNPPWERTKLQEKEFFAGRAPEIAGAANAAARKKLVTALATDRPALWREYRAALRKAEGESLLARECGRYPLTGRGDINTYALFAETSLDLVAPTGRVGMIVPTAIGTGDTTAPFFRRLVETATLAAFLDFENEAKIFADVDHRVRFALLVVTGAARVETARFAFSTRYLADLRGRTFAMHPQEILLVNPNSGTTPTFRSRRDAEITIGVHRRLPVLWRRGDIDDNPWGLSFMAMFHMANDSRLFRTAGPLRDEGWSMAGNAFARGDDRMLPLYEAKMVHLFDSRYGTYEGQTRAQANVGTLPRLDARQHDPHALPVPRYWVAEKAVHDALAGRWDRKWLLGWRDIARSVDERTMIATAIPRSAVGDKFLLALPSTRSPACLQANLSALVLDYAVRQKHSGTSLKYHVVRQLPVLPPSRYDEPTPWDPDVALGDWVVPRVLELSYTGWDLAPYARDHGDSGPPFRWDETRRAQLRAELDAAYFHLYGLDRGDTEHVLDSFFVLRNNEERASGEYLTRRLVLDAFDQMVTGRFTSPLDPAPGAGPRHDDRS